MKSLVATLAFLLLAAPAMAHSYQKGEIQIGHIWARATAPGGKVAGVFVPLLNNGKTADKLVKVSTPFADNVQIHETKIENGISRMQQLEGLPLPPAKPVAMRPGGKHIMLMGIKQQLKEGDKFPVTLEFEHAGSIEVEVIVHAHGATSGDH